MSKHTTSRGPLAIIGPSGCGKTTLLRAMVSRSLITVVPTWTDRPRRPDEEEMEHRFVSAAAFDDLMSQGRFAEVVQPFDLPYRYGLPRPEARNGPLVVVMIRAPFVPLFRRYFPSARVYQLEASYEFAERAIQSRGDTEHGTRLQDFEAEAEAGRRLADRVFVNNGDDITVLADAMELSLRADGLIT